MIEAKCPCGALYRLDAEEADRQGIERETLLVELLVWIQEHQAHNAQHCGR